jgi:hypothetical protein
MMINDKMLNGFAGIATRVPPADDRVFELGFSKYELVPPPIVLAIASLDLPERI